MFSNYFCGTGIVYLRNNSNLPGIIGIKVNVSPFLGSKSVILFKYRSVPKRRNLHPKV